jgi:hypothetical protein
MNRHGHRWVSVTVFSLLVGGGLWFDFLPISGKTLLYFAIGMIIVWSTATLPDHFKQVTDATHRNPVTHSLPFAAIAGATLFGLVYPLIILFKQNIILLEDYLSVVHTVRVSDPTLIASYVAIVGMGTVALHVFIDPASTGGGWVIYPLGPTSTWSVSLRLYKSDSTVVNRGATIVGKLVLMLVTGYLCGLLVL